MISPSLFWRQWQRFLEAVFTNQPVRLAHPFTLQFYQYYYYYYHHHQPLPQQATVDESQTFIPHAQQATPPMYFWKFSCNSWLSKQRYDEITKGPVFFLKHGIYSTTCYRKYGMIGSCLKRVAR